jgi:putative ABC transport system ATP-binding protein
MPPVIDLTDIHRTYTVGAHTVHAVRGVSLRVEPGEFVAIMGSSGSGKSTLMNILGCLDRPTSGRYELDGLPVTSLSRDKLGSDALAAFRSRKIGFVFQGFNLLQRTSALENVELPLLYVAAHLPAGEISARARRALEQVGLAHRAHHTPNELSGGQQQRVAIARALVGRPALLLADEPTGNLDSRTSIEIMGLFQELNAAGMTIVMVTHELDIARYAGRVVLLRDGRIVSDRAVCARAEAAAELARLPAEETAGA